jgi:hypothetical protein
MTAKTRSFVFACALGASVSVLAIPTASAITWDFGPLHPGLLGTTQGYTVSGVTLTAAGFSSAGALAGAPNVALFGKTGGGNENGLGLANDPTPGENEIQGTSLVQIAMAAGLNNVTFQMASTTGSDAWEVWGSSSATALGAPIILSGNDELSHPLPFFAFYNFGAAGFSPASGNVLLGSISAVPGPIVGAGLPGLVAACGGLLALARRRRRQVA